VVTRRRWTWPPLPPTNPIFACVVLRRGRILGAAPPNGPPKGSPMNADQLTAALDAALVDRQLLDHPFYLRWEAGKLEPGEIGAYAAQYRYFETALPSLLRGLLSRLDPGLATDLVLQNLADEEGNPEPHVVAFARFADAVGAADAPATPATDRLLDTYRSLSVSSGAEGLAAVVAYEMQAPAIAASKANGLRRHYGIDQNGTYFWDIHATMDLDHARWGIEALAALEVPASRVTSAARAAVDAWWGFLDDRESAAALASSAHMDGTLNTLRS
jgi:pyrroloquinoline-quinone synthase